MVVDWTNAFKLEQKVAGIIHRQEKAGFQFDKEKALHLVGELQIKEDGLYSKIRPILSMELIRPYKGEVKAPFLKSGGYRQSVIDWYTTSDEVVYIPDIGGPFSRIEWEEPSLSKKERLKAQLIRLGWKPEWRTEKGSPQLTRKGVPAPSLNKMSGTIGENLSLWFTYAHRHSQINGWLFGPKTGERKGISPIRPDGRIPARANSLGTPTARMRHSIIVNVPKAKEEIIYGKEMRSLFIAKEGYELVGHDASGLEARMEAHYTYPFDDGEYAREILDGDIHAKNAIIFGVVRDIAKNGKYCLTYGGQYRKLATVLGCSVKKAKQLFDAFWEGNYALNQLRLKLEHFYDKHGWIPGLDGRKIHVRSKHALVNTLFQSAGAIVMKVSMCFLDDWVERYNLDATKVGDFHDEGIAEVLPKHAEQYKELAVKSIIKAGEYLNLRCPLDASAAIGDSWMEIH